ncbi:MAG: PEP-CTERM sorting domain-containing protein [Phycisphaerales bacterium]|nr:PEP-CTERM sorting domain-containing protein [Phycisphaerales bacterium]
MFNYFLYGDTDSPNQTLKYINSTNQGFLASSYFNEGQGIQENMLSSSGNLIFGFGGGGQDGDPYILEFAGTPGQQLYVGFMVETNVGPTTEINYGFIQLENVDGDQLRFVGWAYETTAGADIVTFSIPNPSSMALLGLAGVGATRRRRV